MSDDLILNFPEKYYVGFSGKTPPSISAPPLAFATPFGTDAAFRKRKETVDSWIGTGVQQELVVDDNGNPLFDKNGKRRYTTVITGITEPTVYDNELLEGFKFDRSVARWSTSNKVFRIIDPRGFQLEISAENLSDIILNGVISEGVLGGRYIWARHGGGMYLARENHPSYIQSMRPKLDRPLQKGDIVYLASRAVKQLYCGSYYFYGISYSSKYEYAGYNRKYKYKSHSVRTLSPVHIFKDCENGYRDGYVTMVKRPSKITHLSDDGPKVDMELGKMLDLYGIYEYTRVMLFDSKEACKAYDPSIEEIREILQKSDYRGEPFTEHEHRDIK